MLTTNQRDILAGILTYRELQLRRYEAMDGRPFLANKLWNQVVEAIVQGKNWEGKVRC